MLATVLLAVTPVASCQVAALAEIIEGADGAARVTVAGGRATEDTAVEGLLIDLAVKEVLWGDASAALSVWSPRSPCERLPVEDELVIGYTIPSPEQAAHLRVPQGTLLLCGAEPARPGLEAAIRSMRAAAAPGDLERLLDRDDAGVRRQAFRLLKVRFLTDTGSALIARLLPRAAGEPDPELRGEYFAAFAHFRFTDAWPVVAEAVLQSERDAASESAEHVFHRVACPQAVAHLAAAYAGVPLGTKGGILRALARVESPEARALVEEALECEDTCVPALDALRDARAARPGRRRAVPAEAREIRRAENHGDTP